MSINKSASLTTGTVWKKLLIFTIPILVGNLFQQLYNTVDSIVVGNYVGSDALAAVGASAPLINLLIGFFMGLASGAGVVVARYFGAQQEEPLRKSINTFLAFSFLSGLFMMVVGVFCSRSLLIWMDTPLDILDDASLYLRIYFAGVIANMLYNAGAGILRAVGDSKRPLYYLIISVILNIGLDMLFVIYFRMGVAGVAYATIICQIISAILVMVTLMCTKESYRVRVKEIRMDFHILKQIIRIGVPAGLQQVIVSFSNVLVQKYVNSFGSAAVAGFSSANKIDSLLGMITQSSALSITTFVSQNIGAGQIDRVKAGLKSCLYMTYVAVIVCAVPLFFWADYAIMLFVDEPEVIRIGAMMIRIIVPFYVCIAYSGIMVGALRGAGYSTGPMLSQILNYCIIRQIYLFLVMRYLPDIRVVFWGYSLTWITADISIAFYAYKSRWLTHNRYLKETGQ